ncbi:hypothetical protein [Alteromonas sp. 14N.309.X.WAT.G.H12]|uniref:hypothetical protein n=1 Tax=Alteromonas sp. 14N.309.X.WAT.G.H12 TaxID=3120824 RepID=UPI002FD5D1BB
MKRAQPLTLGEKHFPSLTAAAQHFNMSVSTVSRRHSKGESYAEIFGVQDPMGTKGKAQGRAKSIKVGETVFSSIAAFARHYNMDPAKVRVRLHNGDTPEEILASAEQHAPTVYKIDGQTFSSVKALARHYKMNPKKVQENLDKGLSIAQAVGISFVPHTQSSNTMSMVIDNNAYFSLDEIINAFNLDKRKLINLIAEQHTFQDAVDILRKSDETQASAVDEEQEPFELKQQATKKKGSRTPVEATAARSQPITCDGKVYPSQRELARSFGVSPHALRYALKSGKTPEEAVGLVAPSPAARKNNHHNAKPIHYQGVEYGSIREFADTFNVPVASVRYRLSKGENVDDILTSHTQKVKPKLKDKVDVVPGAGPQSVFYRGKEYRSIRAFARQFDCDAAQVRYRLKKGWTPGQAIGREEAPKKAKSSNDNMVNITQMMPVTVKNTVYHTAKALAEGFGLKPSVVAGRLRNGWSPEAAVELIPHRVGKSSAFLRVANKTFNNARELAEAYNAPYRTVQYRLSQGASAPEAVGLKEWKGKPHRGQPVHFKGVEYASKKEIAEAFGVDYNKFLSRTARGWSVEKALDNPSLELDTVENAEATEKERQKTATKKAKGATMKKAPAVSRKPKKAKLADSKPQKGGSVRLDSPISMGRLKFENVIDFSDKLGLDPHLVANRLAANWTPEQIAGLKPAP